MSRHRLCCCCLFFGAWSTGALAVQPPPAYSDEISLRLAREARAASEGGQPTVGEEVALAGRRLLGDDPRLGYELAFALNAQGRTEAAEAAYREVVAKDPTQASAWYDLGELLLARDDLDGAAGAFGEAARLRPDHWAGPFRLADVAARRRDPVAFEAHLQDALRAGFTFRLVVEDPGWRGFLKDPVIGPVLRRLVTVYGDERLLDLMGTGG